MKDENILYWIWLSERCGAASKDFARLCERYEDPFELYRMESEEIERIEGISSALKLKLFDKSLLGAYDILKYCKKKKVDIITYGDARYPSRLRSIQDPPVLLYVLGRLPNMDDRLCVGIVGTRKMSEYGRDSAYKISYELASANAVVVSGMALGIDGVAACGALAAGGDTVAVLGCGISVSYPKVHARLRDEIAKHGAVITEYAPTEAPHGYNFPRRNRIISGLCQGLLVVEGSSKSGSLITAKYAIEQGREVFALPGKINESNSEGPNELIKSGASVALSSDDIVVNYDFLYHDCINYKGLRTAKSGGVSVDRALAKYRVSDVYSRENSYRPEKVDAPQATVDTPSTLASHPSSEEVSEERVEANEEKITLTPSVSAELLAGLDGVSRKVYECLSVDRAVSADAIIVEGVGIGDIITALTMLEISGLVESRPGGLYIRK